MADENKPGESEEQRGQRLKELEESLAKELDDPIKVSADKAAPKTGNKDVATGVKPAAADQDVSLDDIDSMLFGFDDGLKDQLDDLSNEVGEVQMPKEIKVDKIDDKYFDVPPEDPAKKAKEEAAKKAAEEEAKKKKLDADIVDKNLLDSLEGDVPPEVQGPGFVKLLAKTIFSVGRLAVLTPARALGKIKTIRKDNPPKKVLGEIGPLIKPLVEELKADFKDLWKKIRSVKRQDLIRVGALALLVFGIYYLVGDATKNLGVVERKDPFLGHFKEVADSYHDLEDDGEEGVDTGVGQPEYAVLIKRIIANLKPLSRRYHPIAAVELYLEASNQECAMELKDRELEIRDIVARSVEGITFAEAETIKGKNRLKVRIRSRVNRILNKGRVRGIFFKSFHIQQ